MNRIGFWNVHNKVDLSLISSFCAEYRLDLLILCEVGNENPLHIASQISRGVGRVFSYANHQSFRVKVFSSLIGTAVVPLMDHNYFSALKVSPPLGPEFLLVGVHLPSKDRQESCDQTIIAQRVSNHVRSMESSHNIDKTLVMGDFNMNPFEHGMVNSDGFHAVMDRRIAERERRTVLFEAHPFFYNPMWSLQGDVGTGPPGSFYQQRSQPLCYFWNLFDQAIFRAGLLPYLPPQPVSVVEKIAGVDLLGAGGFPDDKISDHLPIVVSFKSNNEVNNVN